MHLECERQGGPQAQLAARHGVPRPAVSRRIEHAEGVLGRFGPAAVDIHGRMGAARTVDKLQSALRGAMACPPRMAQAPSGPPAPCPGRRCAAA